MDMKGWSYTSGWVPICKPVIHAKRLVTPLQFIHLQLFCQLQGATAHDLDGQQLGQVPSGELTFCHGKSTISMAMFNSYVTLPEGNITWICHPTKSICRTQFESRQNACRGYGRTIGSFNRSISKSSSCSYCCCCCYSFSRTTLIT